MKIQTKLTALLIAVFMIAALLPVAALTVTAAEPAATDVVAVYDAEGAFKAGYASFGEAWEAALTGETIKLLANCSSIKTGSRGAKTGNRNLTLDLNGFVLKPFASEEFPDDYRVIYVERYATLTVKDSNPTAVHKYTVGSDGLYTLDDVNGTVEIAGGVITGGRAGTGDKHDWGGGAILVQGGYLIVEGGNFIGNSGKQGGAIHVTQVDLVSPALKITGGLFVGNKGEQVGSDTLGGAQLNVASDVWGNTFDLWQTSEITGGTYSDKLTAVNEGKITNVLVPGYGFVEDTATGWFTIQLVSYKETVGGVDHWMQIVEQEVAATCEKDGKTAVRKCTAEHEAGVPCTYTDGGAAIEKTGHTEEVLPAVEATCIKAGKTEGSKCSVCGKKIIEQEKIDPKGHTGGDWVVDKEPTETEEGREIQYCTSCGDAVDLRSIPALGSETEASTSASETETTAAPVEEKGCGAVIGSSVGLMFAALLGGCVLCRKKED